MILKSKWLSYYLPIAITLFMTITLERSVVTDGGFDKLYGFPFGYISNNSGCTHCFEVYLFWLITDIIFYFILVQIICSLLQKFKINARPNWILLLFGLLITICWIFIFYTIVFESSFRFFSDTAFKVLSKRLHAGIYSW